MMYKYDYVHVYVHDEDDDDGERNVWNVCRERQNVHK